MVSWLRHAEPMELARWGLTLVLALGAMAGVMILGLDQPIRETLGAFGRGSFGHAWGQAAYWMGMGGVQIAAAVLIILAAMRKKNFIWRRLGLDCLYAVIVAGLSTQVIKHLVGRARPRLNLSPADLMGPTFDSDWHSFASGHAATSFALAAVLAARWPHGAPVFYTLAAFIALGRVISGSHYASDVLGGMALGLAVGWALALRGRMIRTEARS
ncbi:MAG: phosphatase PAP2 family protein [Desulfarculaceae bacterium]|nr:phosphatase PAP2 family protein [Desulfarculaceae bacterium]MCF8072247.1 phosphatase PAP2 family protein [Desulfarculaceae bacterium]MCF8100168.1 phosphatase PAP2 family protein [Desulfarculaceae bacterium]MCF8117889.1 phosphatase PAP2 family protein [Desulfarculaceae bacterium]